MFINEKEIINAQIIHSNLGYPSDKTNPPAKEISKYIAICIHMIFLILCVVFTIALFLSDKIFEVNASIAQ